MLVFIDLIILDSPCFTLFKVFLKKLNVGTINVMVMSSSTTNASVRSLKTYNNSMISSMLRASPSVRLKYNLFASLKAKRFARPGGI